MNRIGADDFGRAAEQARRALEAAQAETHRQAERQRAAELAAQTQTAPELDVATPEPQSQPSDTLERNEPKRAGFFARLQAKQWQDTGDGRPVLDGALAAVPLLTPIVATPTPDALETTIAVRSEEPFMKSHAVRRDQVDLDRQALATALGVPVPAAAFVAEVAASEAATVTWQQGRALAVPRLSWDEASPRLVGEAIGVLASKSQALHKRAGKLRNLLLDTEGGGARIRLGLMDAAGFLEKAAFKAGTAGELLVLRTTPRDTLTAMAAAETELRGVHAEARSAVEALTGFQSRVRGLPAVVSETRELVHDARRAERETSVAYAETSLLEVMNAGTSLYADELPADGTAVAPPEGAEGPGVLTEEDLARLGTGLDPNKPPPQIAWTEQMVTELRDLGKQQGGSSDADFAKHHELARMALGTEGADPAGPAQALEATDVLAVLKMAGIPLEKVDPNQLQAAATFVSSAKSLTDQQTRLGCTIDNFQVLGSIGLPRMTRKELGDSLWVMAKVPTHATEKLSDVELRRSYDEIVSALNSGPGRVEMKVGKHNLKLELGIGGQVVSSSCKKPGLFSRIGSFIKKVAPLALTVASFAFTAGVGAAIIRGVQAGIGAIQAIRSKSLLGIAAAGASLVGAGAGLVNRGAGLAGRVAKVANSVSRSLQGVASIRSGNLIGGLASLGSGIAGGLGALAGNASQGLGRFANQLSNYSTKLSAVGTGVSSLESYRTAGRAVDQARRALEQARASGDRGAITDAEQQLRQAESQKRTAILGAASGAFEAASLWASSRAQFEGDPALGPPPPGAASRLQLIGSGLRVASNVSGGDYLAAAVSGLSVAANIDSDRHGGQSSTLTDASRMADAGLGYHRAQQGLSASEAAVKEAESRVIAARALGDPAQLEQAQAELNQARRGLESSVMGSLSAGESLVNTAQSVAADRQVRPVQEALQRAKADIEKTTKTAASLDELAASADTPHPLREAALLERQRLDEATQLFQQEMVAAKGNPAQEAAARQRYGAVAASVDESQQQIRMVLAARPSGPGTRSSSAGGGVPSGSVVFASYRGPSAGEPGEPTLDPGGTAPSGRPTPERVVELPIWPGLTLWEVAMRSGVSVEQLRAFNADLGNPLVDEKLQVGKPIYVPMGEGWQTKEPKSAADVAAMRDRAKQEAARPAATVPPLRTSDTPIADTTAAVDRLLVGLKNDFGLIEDDVKRSEFKLGDPSTWVDTREDDAKIAARASYKQAADNFQSLLTDPTASEAQRRQAQDTLTRARNTFNQARGVTEVAAANADYLTPLKEGIQLGQDSVHRATGRAADRIEESGLPPAVVAAATFPLFFAEDVLSFQATVAKGVVNAADGIAGTIAHPIETGKGVVTLIDRAAQTTVEGQATQFLAEVAFGRFNSVEEAAQDWQRRSDPLALAQAKVDFTTDLGRAMFAESIRLAQQGRYGDAVAMALGENVDIALGAGIVRAGRLGTAGRIVDAAADAQRAARAAEAARLADAASDANKVLGHVDDVRLPAKGTQVGDDVGKIPLESDGPGEQLLLPAGNPTTRTLGEVRRLRGTDRWQAAEGYVRELYGSPGERHFPVPDNAWPEPIKGAGGRFTDAPVDLAGGRVLANEVKIYQEWRTVRGSPEHASVPLSDQIQQQVLKDVWLRRHAPGYDPRWIFLDAPPSSELASFLKRHNVTHVQYK